MGCHLLASMARLKGRPETGTIPPVDRREHREQAAAGSRWLLASLPDLVAEGPDPGREVLDPPPYAGEPLSSFGFRSSLASPLCRSWNVANGHGELDPCCLSHLEQLYLRCASPAATTARRTLPPATAARLPG
jgi:hypothetical protein